MLRFLCVRNEKPDNKYPSTLYGKVVYLQNLLHAISQGCFYTLGADDTTKQGYIQMERPTMNIVRTHIPAGFMLFPCVV